MEIGKLPAARAAAIALLATLGACSTIQDTEGLTSAEPLVITDKDFDAAPAAAGATVSKYAIQSIKSCTKFVNKLLLNHGSFNYTSDVFNSALSAAAAVTTPATAAHVLAAGATVVGASKTSFDGEFFANATAGTLQTAISKTYFTEMDTFLKRLSAMDSKDIKVYWELANLQQIHANCTLGAAQSTIQATVAAAPASAASGAQAPASGASSAHTTSLPGNALQFR
jgi:hypothetical protein